MNDLDKFKEQSKMHDLCSSYLGTWNGAKSKKELFELACDSNSVSWMCESLRDGWGLSPDYIYSAFSAYINGKYICEFEFDGTNYTSAMLCKNTDKYEVKSTITVVLDSQCDVIVPSGVICSIYCCNSSNISVYLGNKSKVYIHNYGGEVELATPEYEKDFILKDE